MPRQEEGGGCYCWSVGEAKYAERKRASGCPPSCVGGGELSPIEGRGRPLSKIQRKNNLLFIKI